MTASGRPAAYPRQAQASPVPAVMTGAARNRGWPELEIYAGTAGEERHDSDLVGLTPAIAGGRHDALLIRVPGRAGPATMQSGIAVPAGSAHDRP